MAEVALFNWNNFAPALDGIIFWFGVFLILCCVAMVAFFFLHFVSYRYKTRDAYELLFDESGRPYRGKSLKNRFKWNKNKTAWRPLFPLFNKIEFPAFPPESIMRDRFVCGARLPNGLWIPATTHLNIVKDVVEVEEDGEKKTKEVVWAAQEFSPFPHYLSEHYYVELQKTEQEYQTKNKWEEARPFIIFVACCLFCLVLCGATIYFTYNYASSSFEQIQTVGGAIGEAIKNAANIPAR